MRRNGARRSVTQDIVEAITRDVRAGQYRVGERIPNEQALAEEFGVGRSAVREAVRELIARDMVEIRPGRGTFVRSVHDERLLRSAESEEDVARLELLEFRRIVEPESAALAALRATQEDLSRLAYDVDRLSEAIGHGFRPPEDLGFHLDVVRAAHNRSLARMGGAIMSFYERDGALPTERDAHEHLEILEAIRAHDADAARTRMIVHLPVDTLPIARRASTVTTDSKL